MFGKLLTLPNSADTLTGSLASSKIATGAQEPLAIVENGSARERSILYGVKL